MFSGNNQTIFEESRPPYEPILKRQFTNKKTCLTRKLRADKENDYCPSFSEITSKDTPSFQKKYKKYLNEFFSTEINFTFIGNKDERVIAETKIIKRLMFEGDANSSFISTSKKNMNQNNMENEQKNNSNFITFMVKTLTDNMKHFPLETLQILLEEMLEDKSNTLKEVFYQAIKDLITAKSPTKN